MSGMYGNPRRSRTKSPIDDYLKKSLLAKVNKSELKLLRVAIRRGDGIGGGGPHLPLERSIDDPVRICSYVHYRKDEDKKPKPPIFGRGIKVNQDFTENRRVFTHETRARRSRSRSKQRARSRSPVKYRRSRSSSRDKKSKSLSRNRRSKSRKRSKNTHLRSRSRDRSKSKSHRSRSQRSRSPRSRSPRSRSKSRYRSRSKERRYSSDRRKYKDNDRIHSSNKSRYSRSSSRSRSPHEHKPSCPLYGLDENRQKKSLTPLRPGEYRPGHPDLALRSKRNSKRSRSRSYDGGSRSKRSQSLDNLPSTSRERLSSERHYDSSKSSRKYQSPIKGDRRERQSKSRLSPDYKRPHHSGPHEEYGYFEGWGPGPRLPTGRGGGFAMQPFYAPPFHPRGMMPGPLMHPGLMMHRMPIMAPYGPYRPHLPIYNSGAVRQRGPRAGKPATITITEQETDGDSNVVITEETSQNGDQTNKSLPESERKDNENDERKEEQKEEAKE